MTKPLILYDAGCNLCNKSVEFIRIGGGRAKFRFEPLQASLPELVAKPAIGTIILEENERVSESSTAALRIMRTMQPPWSLLYLLILIPRPLRDWAYRIVARNRYRWFGRCKLPASPTSEVRSPAR